MVFFNYTTMEMSAKIVYYGPGLCGKTTNLQYIYNHIPKNRRGEMVSLPTETDRTLFFDLLPLKLGKIGGFTTRLQLYTVPGQVFYNSTRKLVLKGVDAVVFVADSQVPMLDANIESLDNLQENLNELKLNLKKIPWVIQYNKRDLKNILSVEELNKRLNTMNVPFYEASAVVGIGVVETLKGISKLTLQYLKRKAGYTAVDKTAEIQRAPEEEEDIKIGVDAEVEPEAKAERKSEELKPAERIAWAPSVLAKPQPEPVKPQPLIELPPKELVSKVLKEKRESIIKEVVQSLTIPIAVSGDRVPEEIQVNLNLQLTFTFEKTSQDQSIQPAVERSSLPKSTAWSKER